MLVVQSGLEGALLHLLLLFLHLPLLPLFLVDPLFAVQLLDPLLLGVGLVAYLLLVGLVQGLVDVVAGQVGGGVEGTELRLLVLLDLLRLHVAYLGVGQPGLVERPEVAHQLFSGPDPEVVGLLTLAVQVVDDHLPRLVLLVLVDVLLENNRHVRRGYSGGVQYYPEEGVDQLYVDLVVGPAAGQFLPDLFVQHHLLVAPLLLSVLVGEEHLLVLQLEVLVVLDHLEYAQQTQDAAQLFE